jgi:copper chaperone
MMESLINVDGMSCVHCVNAITSALYALNGVNSVNIDLQKGEVIVKYNNSLVTLDKIKEEIINQGYIVK